MALFKVKVSKKIETSIRLEESTAKMLDRYAQFHKSPADDVVNEALEYIFTKDKEFQQQLAANPDAPVQSTLRVKAPTGAAASAAKKRTAAASA